jgi:hypothetical protein
MLAYQIAPRVAWYRSLWARRDELNSALNARLAEPIPGTPPEPASVGQEVRF